MSREELLKEQSIPHDSANKHVSGFAKYTDDISEPFNTLHGAIGWSKHSHAIIKKIDLREVKKSEGVISIVTYKDIVAIPAMAFADWSEREGFDNEMEVAIEL